MGSSQSAIPIVMMGLDNAGKSTALYRMRTGQYCPTIPTIGFNCERVKGKINKSKDVIFTIWDVGGQERVRPLWRTFARGAEGIMFVLDSADVSTLEEARLELTHILKHADTSSLPILVLANKQDRTEACDPAYLKFFLLGGNDTVKSSDAIQIQGACAITGQGLDESLDMLYEMILNARKKSSSTSPGKQHHNQHHSKRSIR